MAALRLNRTALFLVCTALQSTPLVAAEYASLRIVAPAHDSMVHDNNGRVAVALELVPSLDVRAGDRVVLLLDDKPVASGSAAHYVLTGIDRGSHALGARVVGSDGATRIEAPASIFHMWRASRLFPGRKQ